MWCDSTTFMAVNNTIQHSFWKINSKYFSRGRSSSWDCPKVLYLSRMSGHTFSPRDIRNAISCNICPQCFNNTVTHPATSASHLLLIPWDPFGLDGAQSQAGKHVVEKFRHENLQTWKPWHHKNEILVIVFAYAWPWKYNILPKVFAHLPWLTYEL